nr:MAG TPA: tail sheath protein [Caudoviricetes sp.]
MRAIDKCVAGEKRALQQVQRGTDTRIPVAFVKQPTGEPLDPATLEGLAVKVENEGGALSAEPPYTIEGGQLIVEVTKEISESLGVGVYTLKATGRLADPSYEDGYHDYTITTELCRVVRDAVLYTPTTVTANVLAGLKGKDGLNNYQIAVKHGYQGTEEQFAKDIIPKSNYERAKELQGFQGTEVDYLVSLHGAPGESIYDIAVRKGFVGSEQAYLDSQKGKDGKSAYQAYLETTTDNPKMTEAQYAAINATTTQYLYRINKGKDVPMNEQTLSADQLMELDSHRRNIINALRAKGAQVSDDDGLETLEEKIGALSIYVPIIFKVQQFFSWRDASFPTMQLSESYRPADLQYCFAQNPYLKNLPQVIGIENAYSISSLANGCTALTTVSLPDFPTLQFADGAFSGCSSLAAATIGNLPKAISLKTVFVSCQSLETATIGSTPKADSVSQMFYNCYSLKSVSLDLSEGDLTNAEYMFSGCLKLTAVTGIIDLTKSTRIGAMFSGCSLLEEVRIKGLKVDIDLSACANLSTESVKFLVENLQQVTGKSITLARAWQTAHTAEAREYSQKAAAKGFTLNFR